ncbi:hypothetical protein B0H11DRAFT_475918 [Mycena galericulata]|nr:hypothetical protein B0H11DRAFT_475918 [Mycena galericulata]
MSRVAIEVFGPGGTPSSRAPGISTSSVACRPFPLQESTSRVILVRDAHNYAETERNTEGGEGECDVCDSVKGCTGGGEGSCVVHAAKVLYAPQTLPQVRRQLDQELGMSTILAGPGPMRHPFWCKLPLGSTADAGAEEWTLFASKVRLSSRLEFPRCWSIRVKVLSRPLSSTVVAGARDWSECTCAR